MRNAQRQSPRADIRSPADIITDAIIQQLEAGTRPWKQPWTQTAVQRPLRSCGSPYHGMNIFWLWMIAELRGFTSPYWMTYRQSQLLGGQVRRGERSSIAVFYKTYGKAVDDPQTGESTIEARRLLRSYAIFNASQIDGLPGRYYPEPETIVPIESDPVRRAELMAFFDAIPADVRHGGDKAYFSPAGDYIQMPPLERFGSFDGYAATRSHETAHWSGGAGRLNREFGKRFGDEKYAAEELVAELTSAVLGSELGLPVDHIANHAAYIGNWLTILKADNRAILTLASKADEAARYLLALGGRTPMDGDGEADEAAGELGLNDDEPAPCIAVAA
jgi:antirestriction protein ArdC